MGRVRSRFGNAATAPPGCYNHRVQEEHGHPTGGCINEPSASSGEAPTTNNSAAREPHLHGELLERVHTAEAQLRDTSAAGDAVATRRCRPTCSQPNNAARCFQQRLVSGNLHTTCHAQPGGAFQLVGTIGTRTALLNSSLNVIKPPGWITLP